MTEVGLRSGFLQHLPLQDKVLGHRNCWLSREGFAALAVGVGDDNLSTDYPDRPKSNPVSQEYRVGPTRYGSWNHEARRILAGSLDLRDGLGPHAAPQRKKESTCYKVMQDASRHGG